MALDIRTHTGGIGVTGKGTITSDKNGDLLVLGKRDSDKLYNTLYLVDISDPSNLSLLYSDFENRADYQTNSVDIIDNILIATYSDSFNIYDISDPSNPNLLSTVSLTFPDGVIWDIHCLNDIIYVTKGETLYIYDISDPSDPVMVNDVVNSEVSDNVENVCLDTDGNTMVSASGDAGFLIYDISDSTNPVFLKQIISNNRAKSVILDGDIIYAGTLDNILKIYDISDVDNPELLKTINDMKFYFNENKQSMSLHDNILATVYKSDYLRLYDVSDPKNPVVIFESPYSQYIFGVLITGDLLLYGRLYESNIYVYDISRFYNDFIDITYADFPEIKFRGNPLKTDNTITEIEVYVNETLQNTYTTNLDQIKSETINENDLVSGDNWITILG
jgi:hypothetical protein